MSSRNEQVGGGRGGAKKDKNAPSDKQADKRKVTDPGVEPRERGHVEQGQNPDAE